MIAEKTADNIRGRKLAPFEPRSPQQHPPAPSYAAPNLQYRTPARPLYRGDSATDGQLAASGLHPFVQPGPPATQEQQEIQEQQLDHHTQQLNLRLQQQAAQLANQLPPEHLARAAYQLEQAISSMGATQTSNASDWSSYEPELVGQTSGQPAEPSEQLESSASEPQFWADRYAQSSVADTLLKSMRPMMSQE